MLQVWKYKSKYPLSPLQLDKPRTIPSELLVLPIIQLVAMPSLIWPFPGQDFFILPVFPTYHYSAKRKAYSLNSILIFEIFWISICIWFDFYTSTQHVKMFPLIHISNSHNIFIIQATLGMYKVTMHLLSVSFHYISSQIPTPNLTVPK